MRPVSCIHDLDGPSKNLLSRAYDTVCAELQSDYQLNPDALGKLSDVITSALLDLYRAGQCDERQLARYAVWRALRVRREKSLGLGAPLRSVSVADENS